MGDIYQYTSKRLQSFEVFDASIIDKTAETIERVSYYRGFGHFFDVVGIDEDEVLDKGIVDIKPKDFDESSALVIHLPMANPLDGNQVYQIATLSQMFPKRRVIAAANPSGINASKNQLWDTKVRSRTASGDFRFATPALDHYFSNKSNVPENSGFQIDQIGFSLGVDLAMGFALRETIPVNRQLLVEPASVTTRSVIGLASTFGRTNKALQANVEVNNLQSFLRVREKLGISETRYALGLLRLSNLALSRGIARGTFGNNLETLFIQNNNAPRTTVMWGSETEFGAEAIEKTLNRIELFTKHKIGKIVIQGGKHAMVNDLALMSAAALQSLA